MKEFVKPDFETVSIEKCDIITASCPTGSYYDHCIVAGAGGKE